MPDVRFTRKYSIGWFSAKYEHLAMSKLDYFSLPSVDRLIYYPNWTKKESFFYIPNFPRFSTFANIDLQNRFEKFTIIFQGAIGEGHGIEDIIKILKNFSNVQLVLKGPVRENYKRKIEQLSSEERVAEQITWVGLTSYSELINLTSKCHLGIAIHQGSDEVSKTLGTASNKIYEYLACGLPLILHDSDQFRKNLSDEPFVFYYNGEIRKLEEILNDVSNNFNELSNKAREAFCSNYTFEAYFNPVIEQMNA
jgi:glycosyltransferase involved in cell wall biosynthesis